MGNSLHVFAGSLPGPSLLGNTQNVANDGSIVLSFSTLHEKNDEAVMQPQSFDFWLSLFVGCTW